MNPAEPTQLLDFAQEGYFCSGEVSETPLPPMFTAALRYWTANSSEFEFNVDALLKTTTGMSMEDLRQHMKNLKSTRRRRALEASFDAVLSDLPSDENVRIRISKLVIVPIL